MIWRTPWVPAFAGTTGWAKAGETTVRDNGILVKAGKTTVIPAQAGIQDHGRKADTRIFE
jgi:hypothetical protein